VANGEGENRVQFTPEPKITSILDGGANLELIKYEASSLLSRINLLVDPINDIFKKKRTTGFNKKAKKSLLVKIYPKPETELTQADTLVNLEDIEPYTTHLIVNPWTKFILYLDNNLINCKRIKNSTKGLRLRRFISKGIQLNPFSIISLTQGPDGEIRNTL
jgi:hypothetical protein